MSEVQAQEKSIAAEPTAGVKPYIIVERNSKEFFEDEANLLFSQGYRLQFFNTPTQYRFYGVFIHKSYQ